MGSLINERNWRFLCRQISLVLIFSILLELVAPACWALPEPEPSSPPTRSEQPRHDYQPIDPQLAKVLSRNGHPVPELPGDSGGLNQFFPDPNQVCLEPSPTPSPEAESNPTPEGEATPSPETTATPAPRRYPVTPENLRARAEAAVEANRLAGEAQKAAAAEAAAASTSSEPSYASTTSAELAAEPAATAPSKEDTQVSTERSAPTESDEPQKAKGQLAYVDVDPQAIPPQAEWSRLTTADGQYYPMMTNNTAYVSDELVALARDYKDLGADETIQWDALSPVALDNQTSLNSAASVVWKLKSEGLSPSSLNSKYTFKVYRYDRRSPHGRLVFTQKEPMQLCNLRLSAFWSAKTIGNWTINTSRNGQSLSQDSLRVVSPPVPTDDWSRYRLSTFKAAADLIFYVSDEFVARKRSFTLPAPDSQGQQFFQVSQDWLAPASAALNHTRRNSYASLVTTYESNGTTWSRVNQQFSPSYPAGRILSHETGDGRLTTLDVVFSQGLPRYGDWQLRTSVRGGATSSETAEVREIRSSVSSDTPTLPLEGPHDEHDHAIKNRIPFHVKIETFPSSWTPDQLDYSLSLNASNGQTRSYLGRIMEGTQTSHSAVVVWDGLDDQAKIVPLGVQVDPNVEVRIPEPARVARFAAAAAPLPYVPAYFPIVGTGCYYPTSLSSQYLYSGDTVTYSQTFSNYNYGGRCFPLEFHCDGAVNCTVNGFPAPSQGGGAFGMPSQVYSDAVATAASGSFYTVTAVYTMGQNLTPQFWADGATQVFPYPVGPHVGTHNFTYQSNVHDVWGVAIMGNRDTPPPPPSEDDVAANGKKKGATKKDDKKTEQTCGCDCPPNEVQQNSPLLLNVTPGSGLYTRNEIDLAVATRGFPLTLFRTNHSRQGILEQPNGWSWGFQDRLVVDTAANVIYHRKADGHSDAFYVDGTTIQASRQNLTDRLVRIDDRHYERETKGHTRFLYEIPTGISLSEGTDPIPAVLTKITDHNGNFNLFRWDSLGQKLYKMEGSLPGQSISLTWRQGHNQPILTSATDQTGRKVTYKYCAYPNSNSPSGYDDLLSEVVQPGCKEFSYTYHSVMGDRRYVLLTSRVNGVLQEKTVECDTANQRGILMESTHRLSSTMKYARVVHPDDSVTAKITHTAQEGMPQNQDQVTTYEINDDDMVTRVVDAIGNASQFFYDENHNLNRTVDARGHESRSVFDDHQNLISSTDHLNRTTRMSYDAADNLLSVTDSQSGVTRMGWDARNNLISTTDPSNHTVNISRNAFGQVTSVTDPLGHVTARLTYDELGFIKTNQSAAASAGAPVALTTYQNDSLGRPIRITDALGRVVKVRYNERNRTVETIFPAVSAQGVQSALPAARMRRIFDRNDLLRESIAVDGARSVYEYDEAHKLISVQTPGNPVPTRLRYDAMENVVELVNSNRQATHYTLDRLNRAIELKYPGGDSEYFTFDAKSNLVAWNRGDYSVGYTFDELDRLTSLDSPTTHDHIGLTYDNLDRVATMTDNSGTTSYQYTQNYLLDRVTRGTGVIAYGYDGADRLTTLTADGDTTSYSWDDRNRLVRSSLDGQSVTYGYDQADRPTLMSLSNGVTCQQIFNERNGLLSKRYLRGGSPLFTLKNAYNQLGQRIFEEKQTANWTKRTRYGYNQRRELSHSYRRVNNGCTVETAYSYDLNHNRVKKNETRYQSNTNDQLTTVRQPSQRLTYNQAGQAVQVGDSTYTYSYSDQIKTARNGSHTAAYVYDGNGQRVQKTVDGVVSKFLWTGSEIVKEYTGSGQVKAQYFLGGGRTAIKTGGQWNFYLSDGLGSTVMLTDSRGRSVATWDYEDYGETTQMSGSANVYNPFLYTGQELDKETGLYHMRARHYAPSLGKFMSRDPIGNGGGSNLYAYCPDPINFIDPSGFLPDPSPSPGPSPAPGWVPPTPTPSAPPSPSPTPTLTPTTTTDPPPMGGSPGGPSIVPLVVGGTAVVTGVGTAVGTITVTVGTDVATIATSSVWALKPTLRGIEIENYLAGTEYKDFTHVGKLNNGYFPVVDFVDFETGTAVSVKTSYSNRSLPSLYRHLNDLAFRVRLNGEHPCNTILDLRVLPGTQNQFKGLVTQGRKLGIDVRIGTVNFEH